VRARLRPSCGYPRAERFNRVTMGERKTRRRRPAATEASTQLPGASTAERRGGKGRSAGDPQVGRVLSHYRILERLGVGGMGVVYKAEDLRLSRFVAIKLLSPHIRSAEEGHQRFLQEAKAASAIDHPNTCTVYELGQTDDGQLFIVMAFYEGETLSRRIDRGPLPPEEAVGIAHDVACGLARAHAQGIVHRDVKPSNVIITRDGLVKVLDFGIAKLSGETPLTREGKVLGSIDYMSPEQAQGRIVDSRTDIWSLGVLLYQMLTGSRPFQRDNELLTLQAIVHQPPPPLTDLNPPWQESLPGIVARALAKRPADRYAQIGEMAAALATLLPERPAGVSLSTSVLRGPLPSIAVLPFADLSPQQDQEYFCDGLAEELIHVLGRVEGLRVASRSSTFQLKGRKDDVRRLCERLNVATYLEGGIRKAGSRIRVTVQLVNVSDECQIWSGRYDREIEDVFAVQDEIASTLVETLKPRLLGTTRQLPEEEPHPDVEAYNAYLKGRYHWNKRTAEGLREGTGHFRTAIEIAPGYARAHAGLADSYLLLGIYGLEPPREVMPKARAAAERALELDGKLAEVFASLGCVEALYEWRWREAEKDFQRALELDARYATAHQWYAVNSLAPLGRFKEAFAVMERARRLDPLSLPIQASLGLLHYFAGDCEKAVAEFENALRLDPRFAMAHFFLGLAQVQMGQSDSAIASLEKAISLADSAAEMESALGYAYAAAGATERAQQVLGGLLERRERQYVSPVLLAQVHAGLGEADQALRWLDTAWAERAADLVWIAVRPTFAGLRNQLGGLLWKLGLEVTIPEIRP
jgi:serine/threonine protein kinase/tetratricopeptide (TPR) repeat protein